MAGGEAEVEASRHPAEQVADHRTQARLAYRLQHLKTMRSNREMEERRKLSLVADACERYVRQREVAQEQAAQEQDEREQAVRERDERAQERLREFWRRQAVRQHTYGGDADGQAAG